MMHAQPTAPRSDLRQTASDLPVSLALVAFLLAVYLLTYSGVPHSPDEWYFLAGTQAALAGDFAGVQAHGWLFSLLAVPFYVLPRVFPGIGSYQAVSLLNHIVTGLTAVALFRVLRLFHVRQRVRLAVALIYGLATFAWVYSHYLFREPVAGLFLLLTTWAVLSFWRRPRAVVLLAAVLAGVCAVAVKQTLLAFVPFFAGLVLVACGRRWLGNSSGPAPAEERTDKAATRPNGHRILALGALLGSGGLLLALTAPWWSHLIPSYIWQAPKLPIFAALLVSPGWGLLSFNPALWLAVIGAAPFARRYPAAAFITLGGSIFYILASTTHPIWWGAWGFGPRQLLPLAPIVCLAIPAGLLWLRSRVGRLGAWVAWTLVLVSGSFQLLGGVVPFNEYVRQALLSNRIVELNVTWDWQLWPIAGMVRFWQPWLADLAWVSGRTEQLARVRWSVLLPTAAMTLAAAAWLAYLLFGRARRLPRRTLVTLSSLLLAALIPVAGWTLYRVYPDERYYPELGYQAAAETIADASRPGDILVTDLWTDQPFVMVTGLINYCGSACPLRLDLLRDNLVGAENPWRTEYSHVLANYRRAWLALDHVPEGDPNSLVEQWLNEIGYLELCDWQGPQVRLCRYSLAPGCGAEQKLLDARLNGQIALHDAAVSVVDSSSACSLDRVVPGDVIHVTLHWAALTSPLPDLIVSVQLWDEHGQLIQGVDRRPGNSFAPTTSWQPGTTITDRYALEIPSNTPAGKYRLIALMYNPQTAQRLPVRLASGAAGDMAPIGEVQIAE